MISLKDVYHVVAAIVPLYTAMILAYICVKWWKIFTPEQCSGINKFVAKISIPLLSFQVISQSNPYKMNVKLILADFLQKILAFIILAIATKISSRGRLSWIITGISLSTLPNTLILGIPLLRAMYGDEAANLLAQIVVVQSIIWYNVLLFLYEFSATNTVEKDDIAEAEEQVKVTEERKKNIMLILMSVVKKLIINPNTHATILGIIWSTIKFRWGLNMPSIIDKSISIMADGGLGMAMFSLGLFMASQGSLLACGTRLTVLAMAMKFVLGPALMAASSAAIGLKGNLFRIAILQAALPQGIVAFVFAKEYNVHPTILSTGVIFGLLMALPVALGYYFLVAIQV